MSLSSAAVALPTVIDFETEDDFLPGPATPLVNGQAIDSEFGNIFTMTSTVTGGGSGHLGPTIFDSNTPGPNDGGGDPDLQVNLGNILMLQNASFPSTTLDPSFGLLFDTPDDEANVNNAGSIIFNFLAPVELESLDLIDVNGGAHMIVTMTDSLGRDRIYDVPEKWTTDVTVSLVGWQELDLTTLLNQPAEPNATGGDATATEDAGFDPSSVVALDVNISGSGAIDNLSIVPEPTTALMVGVGLAGLVPRRRRS